MQIGGKLSTPPRQFATIYYLLEYKRRNACIIFGLVNMILLVSHFEAYVYEINSDEFDFLLRQFWSVVKCKCILLNNIIIFPFFITRPNNNVNYTIIQCNNYASIENHKQRASKIICIPFPLLYKHKYQYIKRFVFFKHKPLCTAINHST